MRNVLFIITLFYSFDCCASMFIEPYLGYAVSGKGTSTFTSSTKATHSYTSSNYGAKLGFAISQRQFLGAEYLGQSHYLDSTQGASAASDKVFRTQYGIFYNFINERLILYLAYFPFVDFKGMDETLAHFQLYQNKDEADKGSSYAIGFGIRMRAHVTLNLSYRNYNYTSLLTSGVTNSNFTSMKLSDYLISISFPVKVL